MLQKCSHPRQHIGLFVQTLQMNTSTLRQHIGPFIFVEPHHRCEMETAIVGWFCKRQRVKYVGEIKWETLRRQPFRVGGIQLYRQGPQSYADERNREEKPTVADEHLNITATYRTLYLCRTTPPVWDGNSNRGVVLQKTKSKICWGDKVRDIEETTI